MEIVGPRQEIPDEEWKKILEDATMESGRRVAPIDGQKKAEITPPPPNPKPKRDKGDLLG
jgi:hypothetical protein